MPRIGDTRPDPLLRPARQDEISMLLSGGVGCLVQDRPRKKKGR